MIRRPARRRPTALLLGLALAPLLVGAPPARAEAPRLSLPLACAFGTVCFVQHYVDRDESPGVRDYACGSRTYDRHNGTDFRVRTMAEARGEPGTVLAVAAGRVLRVRNDMADGTAKGSDAGDVSGQECGNGLVIAHADGWESQYCHMARGSLKVRPGDTVVGGQALGQVGLSGMTEFPHLHLTVRHGPQVVDPFAPDAPAGSCNAGLAEGAPAPAGLWDARATAALAYHAGSVLNAGFADAPVTQEALEAGTVAAPGPAAGALLAYVRAIGLDAGDEQTLTLTGPDGRVMAERTEPPLARPRAQHLLYAGRKRPPQGWTPGTYTGRYRVLRAGKAALDTTFTLAVPARP